MAEIAIVMPKMSMTMEEGTMVTWHKRPGDEIKVGDVVCEVATDKVDMEVEATIAGVLARQVASDGDVVAVGDPIAWLTSDSEELLGDLFGPGSIDSSQSAMPAMVSDDTTRESRATGGPAVGARDSKTGFVAAMPLARTLARELGLDLAAIAGTGSQGEIVLGDVVASFKAAVSAAGEIPPAAASSSVAGHTDRGDGSAVNSQPVDTRPLLGDAKQRRTRVAVNRLMNASAIIPQFTLRRALDLSAANRVRKTELGGASWTTIVVKAYAVSLAHLEVLNAEWTEDGVRANAAVNVAVAVDTPTGLMVPVVQHAASKSLGDLDAEIKSLATRAREGKLSTDDMAGATGSVSNLGGFGVDSFNALLTPPQATALAVGSLRREVLFDESLRTRPVLDVCLTVDHRVADGATGAKLLQRMQEFINEAKC